MAQPVTPTRKKDSALIAPVAMTAVWQRAAGLCPDEIEAFRPSDTDIQVGEAILAGNTVPSRIAEYCGLKLADVKLTLDNPLAMGWLSRQILTLFTTRAALIDAVLFQRAMTGDLGAIKLFYERMRLLDKTSILEHKYSGEVALKQVPDDELARLVQDKVRLLPAEFRNAADAAADLSPSPTDTTILNKE